MNQTAYLVVVSRNQSKEGMESAPHQPLQLARPSGGMLAQLGGVVGGSLPRQHSSQRPRRRAEAELSCRWPEVCLGVHHQGFGWCKWQKTRSYLAPSLQRMQVFTKFRRRDDPIIGALE